MKKATAAILLLIMLSAFPLTGCEKGNSPVPADTPDPNTVFVTEEPTPEPTAEPTPEPTRIPVVIPTPELLDIPIYPDDAICWGNSYCDKQLSWWILDNFMGYIRCAHPEGIVPAVRETTKNSYAVVELESGYRAFYLYKHRGRSSDMVGCPMLIKTVHSYSDFDSLKIGDSIDAVNEIDPAAGLIKESILNDRITPERASEFSESGCPLMSWHYLTDGMLFIEYTMDDNGELFIENMTYSDSYSFESKAYGSSVWINCTILPCDLPPAWQEVMGG